MPATEHFFWKQGTLHRVFAVSCVVLLLSVIVMMVQDYADEWRAYQNTNFELQAAAKERDIALLKSAEFEAQKDDLTKQRRELEQALDFDQRAVAAEQELLDLQSSAEPTDTDVLDAKAAEIENLRELQKLKVRLAAETNAATREVENLELELKSENAERDEARAVYDLAIRDNLPTDVLNRNKAAYDAAEVVCDRVQLRLENALKALQQVSQPAADATEDEMLRLAELLELQEQVASIDKSIEELEADLILAQSALQKIQPDSWAMKSKRWLMSLPIIEGFNGQQKVTQDWLPALHQTLGMTEIARFDRCRTCHMNMDRTAPGNLPSFPFGEPSQPDDVQAWVAENKFPHPYSTHPNHNLFVTAASPHPVSTFGCTVCHDGQGSGTDFGNAEHTPNDPHQAGEWYHDYGYHPNHFWEYPMQPQRFQESTCIKCHHEVVELGVHPKFGASAPKVYKGYNLIRKYGCFGCHEMHGFDAGKPIGPDMRLEPQSEDQWTRVKEDDTQVAGKFRKVGPSLRHIAAKTSADFISYWTEVPGRYRPSTKMPQFFDLTNQQDEQAQKYAAVELAGIAQVLVGGSEDIELLQPAAEYEPNAERGQVLFSERGCMACHEHSAVPGTNPDFGPNISDIHRKVNRNQDNPEFSDWLYTWLKEPTRYHQRTRMPNLYLKPYVQGEETIDPAADIVAFLLSQGQPQQFPVSEASDEALDELVKLFLKKARFSEDAASGILQTREFPQKAADIAGDERVLATEEGLPVADEAEWRTRKLDYIGRRTISRYGCYGCHDIPGYEEVRPIGVALQDWGRKDTSKLGLEHIEEFLHHHGEENGVMTDLNSLGAVSVRLRAVSFGDAAYAARLQFVGIEDGQQGAEHAVAFNQDNSTVVVSVAPQTPLTVGDLVRLGAESELFAATLVSGSEDTVLQNVIGSTQALTGSTAERVANAIAMSEDGTVSREDLEPGLTQAFFYDSLLHHGRPGFLWQKLRGPRTYDYKKTETKGYDERLRMPKFPLQEDEIDAIATFVLGLVAEPPAEQYVYTPDVREKNRIQGEFLLAKYNCTSCHMIDLPNVTYGVDLETDVYPTKLEGSDHEVARDLLLQLRKPRNALTGERRTFSVDGEDVELPVASFHGIRMVESDPEEDPEYRESGFDTWDTIDFGSEEQRVLPSSRITILDSKLVEYKAGRGGVFAEWLVGSLLRNRKAENSNLAWQAAPPILYQEGLKVQNSWLYQFLLEPEQLRYTTVLRMPRFNMSPAEAQTLANYFAAVDGADFPYQQQEPTDADYLANKERSLRKDGLLKEDEVYLDQCWNMVNADLCIGCHSVGGRKYKKGSDPKSIQGPNLNRVQNRLRADWVRLWLYNPRWITPYTSMPLNFAKNQRKYTDIFEGDPGLAVEGVTDALMNYTRLMEDVGPTVYTGPGAKPPADAAAQPAAGTGAEE